MMLEKNIQNVRRVLLGLTTTFGILSVGIISYAFTNAPTDSTLEGRLLPRHLNKDQEWATISAEDIRKGASLPPHMNTIIHIPEEIDRITRRTLFGRKGRDIRYWGYCFPRTYDEAEQLKKRGFPGTVFLSEREREVRAEEYLSNRRRAVSTNSSFVEKDLSDNIPRRYGAIRHQLEIFEGGMSCYVMSEEPLVVGIDEDGDGANIKIESEYGSDPNKADTDGDGIADGLEIFYLGSHPTRRDSDGDGLIDGIEDKNRNGRKETNESDPMIWDTDGDGLCDGICYKREGARPGFTGPEGWVADTKNIISGEDLNLNGVLDDGETDPTKVDTDRDGVIDSHEFYICHLKDLYDDDYDYDDSDC